VNARYLFQAFTMGVVSDILFLLAKVAPEMDEASASYLSEACTEGMDAKELKEMATPFLEEAGVDVESAVASLCKLVCPSAGPQEDNFVSNAMSVASSVAVSESGSVKKGKKIPKGPKGKKVKGAKKVEAVEDAGTVLDNAVVTGLLGSQAHSMDVKIESFAVTTFGKELVKDTTLEITRGRRYGLIGANGSGKSTILAAIAARLVPIPEHIDIWFLDKEAEPSEYTALEAVIQTVKEEQQRLEKLTNDLLMDGSDEAQELLMEVGERLDKLDPDTFEVRAAELLCGLGFDEVMMYKKTKDMSGGWRMRVALSQALFVQPSLLLLDEPTNHLDLGACVWLENYLAQYCGTIILISHSQDFMDGVCTNIMQLTHKGTLVVWGGNYAQYCKTRTEVEKEQLTKYKKEQDDLKHLLTFIRECGNHEKLRRQADSKQKVVDKMYAAGLTEKPEADVSYNLQFPQSGKLAPPVLAFDNVSFSYSGKKSDYLYTKIDLGVDSDSRVALVGPNGAGKSTLLKLMRGELDAVEGTIKRHGHLRIGVYNQHSEEVLDLTKCPLEFFADRHPNGISTPDGTKKMETEDWRRVLGRYGITGEQQTRPMSTLSHGLRTRIVFVVIALTNPHILMLDEPTNHLDMGMIDALAGAINDFDGGLVLVSHDFRLIGQVANQIWVCDNKNITPWKGDIQSYKLHLKKSAIRSKSRK